MQEPAQSEPSVPGPCSSSAITHGESNNNSRNVLTVQFQNFAELTTNLVLLPRIEEEGVGAVVASCCCCCSYSDNEENRKNLIGCFLTAVKVNELGECKNIRDEEFAEILSTIREAPCPIVLYLERQDVSFEDYSSVLSKNSPDNKRVASPEVVLNDSVEEEKKSDLDDCSDRHSEHGNQNLLLHEAARTNSIVDSEEEESDDDDDMDNDEAGAHKDASVTETPVRQKASPRTSFSFGAWTAQLAAEAASGAAHIKSKYEQVARERAAQKAAMEKIEREKQSKGHDEETKPCKLFVQSSSGAFLPLSSEASSNKHASELCLTNSSLILVRKSATEPCPTSEYSFQWYSSCSAMTDEWKLLKGATSAAFQPSATEVGHRLRCVVQILASDQGDDEPCKVICQTDAVVSAALPLFSGTRQALVRGAQYGGLTGRGNAEGRSFRIKVEMTFALNPTTQKQEPVCAVSILQVSGETAERIHPEPLVGVTAATSHAHPKNFELILPENVKESAAMIAALSEDGYRMQLQAPNRLGRESILLAVGIANYTGKPVDLEASTILFHDTDAKQREISVGTTEVHEEGTADTDEQSESNASADESQSLPSAVPQQMSPVTTPPRPPPLAKRESSPKLLLNPLPFTRSASLDSRQVQESSVAKPSHVARLEEEIHQLRAKLTRKDKVVSELQRNVADTDAQWQKAQQKISNLEEQLQQSRSEKRELQQSLRAAEQNIQSKDEALQTKEKEHAKVVNQFERQQQEQADCISDLEKSNRTLQNEKAVLSAAVEARESKLAKMADLRASLDKALSQVAEQDGIRRELEEAKQRNIDLSSQIHEISKSERDCQCQLSEAQNRIDELQNALKAEKERIASHQSELEVQQMKIQKLKAERNSYKQKGDSLAKEMARICRNGRTVREVEKILADDVARRQEVELLREQKRKALEELENYRTAYEQSKMAQKMAGLDQDSSKLLERNAELTRLLTELTEFVNAKEMQLETMKAVNEAMQAEIHDLAKANMSKNDI